MLSKPSYRELWQVETVTELSRAEFAVSGKVTRLKLKGGENFQLFADEVRNTTVFAVSEPLALAEVPDDSDVSGDAVDVDADVSGMEPGRRLLVRGTTTAGEEHAESAVLKRRGAARRRRGGSSSKATCRPRSSAAR